MTNRQFAKRRFKRSFDPRLVWLRQYMRPKLWARTR